MFFARMESIANEYLIKKDWLHAAEIFTQLIQKNNGGTNNRVKYLLARSKCLFELQQYEVVIADCNRILQLIDDKTANAAHTARQRLMHCLFVLRKFGELELVVQECAALKGGPNTKEATKILQHLHSISFPNDGNITIGSALETELIGIEKRLNMFVMDYSAAGDNMFTCAYCSISFRTKVELRGHCQTEEHQRVIMSDEGRDWHWRAPPRGCSADLYKLCVKWIETQTCRYGTQCIYAHGDQELQEWKERFEYRRMKLQRAYDSELYGKSYTEELVDRLVQTTTPDKILIGQLKTVKVSWNKKLSITLSEKNQTEIWTFTLKSEEKLRAVALLQDSHRSYFFIKSIKADNGSYSKLLEMSNQQEWIAKDSAEDKTTTYHVAIGFCADIYGTLRQSVVFDFGTTPMLVKHLCVDVVPVTDVDKLNEIRREVVLSNQERWTESNAQIIPFSSPITSLVTIYGDSESKWTKHLISVYPSPLPDTCTLSHSTVNEMHLTKNNYRSRMHELLFIEEMARHECIATYNINTKLKIISSYILSPNSTASSTAKYSSSGELFALMHLGKQISEDSTAGRLILSNCTMALLSAKPTSSNVYEALIEDKGKSTIYLRLSAEAVKNLNLRSDMDFKAHIQFQLNRIPYCEWHYAVDKLTDCRVIFPETYLEPNIPWSPSRQWCDSFDSRLNIKQKEAIVAITTPLYVNLPPLLIIGPFGTGKTFTLAQAIKQLIKQPENRILICTQSNSAADIYIKDYLHPHVESGHTEARPLRIYYHKRWVSTVHEIVQKYCLINNNGGVKQFSIPKTEDVLGHRVIVVTLSISMYLSTVGLPRGYFTHIFLDEAAQAMECEAIMPLALASENTRIVLAGDHMQLSPELFSSFAIEKNLNISLLERLYDYYPNDFPCKILLSENYRAHEAIINFTSELFYDQRLVAKGKQPPHSRFYPLTFFTTRGEDIQDVNSTAFYNNAEVYEIVERVQEILNLWPTCWGTYDNQSIGIMTPYADQVLRIRSELRKRRLNGISVERVLNVQGKQFRVVFLSTVRTRRTCKPNKEHDFGFLSNSKLLNTAITRAQSLVAVVGDPVSLCSIGPCSKIWERFINICAEKNSLFGITWSSLKSQLDGVELKKTYTLNPLAPEFIPRKYHEPLVPLHYFPRNGMLPTVIHPIPPISSIPQIPVMPMTPMLPPLFPGMLPLMPPPGMPQLLHGCALYPQLSSPPVHIPNLSPIHVRINQNVKTDDLIPHTFGNNFVFNEDAKVNAGNPTSSLTDYINLLPNNMSLAEMLLQPPSNQEQWYCYLLTARGPEAAKQFKQLLYAANKKDTGQQPPFLTPPLPLFNGNVPKNCSPTIFPQISNINPVSTMPQIRICGNSIPQQLQGHPVPHTPIRNPPPPIPDGNNGPPVLISNAMNCHLQSAIPRPPQITHPPLIRNPGTNVSEVGQELLSQTVTQSFIQQQVYSNNNQHWLSAFHAALNPPKIESLPLYMRQVERETTRNLVSSPGHTSNTDYSDESRSRLLQQQITSDLANLGLQDSDDTSYLEQCKAKRDLTYANVVRNVRN